MIIKLEYMDNSININEAVRLKNLAEAFEAAGDYEIAIQNYVQCIEILFELSKKFSNLQVATKYENKGREYLEKDEQLKELLRRRNE